MCDTIQIMDIFVIIKTSLGDSLPDVEVVKTVPDLRAHLQDALDYMQDEEETIGAVDAMVNDVVREGFSSNDAVDFDLGDMYVHVFKKSV